MCAAGSCCIDGRLSLELTAALARGYQDTRRLTAVEQELFQLHIFYGAAAVFCGFRVVRAESTTEAVLFGSFLVIVVVIYFLFIRGD